MLVMFGSDTFRAGGVREGLQAEITITHSPSVRTPYHCRDHEARIATSLDWVARICWSCP